jgi:hypothetical protein
MMSIIDGNVEDEYIGRKLGSGGWGAVPTLHDIRLMNAMG